MVKPEPLSLSLSAHRGLLVNTWTPWSREDKTAEKIHTQKRKMGENEIENFGWKRKEKDKQNKKPTNVCPMSLAQCLIKSTFLFLFIYFFPQFSFCVFFLIYRRKRWTNFFFKKETLGKILKKIIWANVFSGTKLASWKPSFFSLSLRLIVFSLHIFGFNELVVGY